MGMIPLADLIAGLKRAQVEVRPGMERVTLELMAENAKLSQELVGQELPIHPPLAPSTVREKEALGFVNQVSPTDPNLRTGEFRDSIQPVVHLDMEGVVGEVGSDLSYASAIENGTSRQPPRPVISPPFITMQPRAVAALGELALTLLNPERR